LEIGKSEGGGSHEDWKQQT